jgi:hypothetical protein
MSGRAPISHPLSTEPLRARPAAIIPSADRRQPIVLVIGAPSSGASLCSRVLAMLGVDMLEKIPAPEGLLSGSGDPRHFTQRSEIVEFHDHILELFNRDDSSALRDFPLPVAWWTDPRVVRIRQEISGFVDGKLGDGYFGFEDPRTVRVMPVWQHIIHQRKLAPKILFCLRNPGNFAQIDGLDSTLEEYHWLTHTVEFFRGIADFDICTVEYENWFDDRLSNVKKLLQFLGMECPHAESEIDLALSSIIDRRSGNDSSFSHDARQPLVRSLYNLAKRADRDGEARDQINDIVSQYVGFQQLQQPFQRLLETLAGAEARRASAELESEFQLQATALEVTCDELASVQSTLAESERVLSERVSEAEILRERLASAQAGLAAREPALAEHAAEVDLLRQQLAAMAAELTARDRALADRRSEVGVYRNELKTAQAEIAARERALAEASRQAERASAALAGREAMATAMEAELQVLRGALVVARDVGTAVIAALSASNYPSPRPVAPPRWRDRMMRFFSLTE